MSDIRWRAELAGQCLEATPRSRQRETRLVAELPGCYGEGLQAGFVALLVEVAQIADSIALLASGQAHRENGIGIALVQAARGLLLNQVELRRGCVYDCRFVAPTEGDFHPGGLLAQGLLSLREAEAEDLRQQAEWLVNAVDPCVPFRLNPNVA